MRVAVTGLHAGCRRAPGLAVASCLQAAGDCDVVAMDYDNLATGLYSLGLPHKELLRWPGRPGELSHQIAEIHQKTPIDVILPCLNDDIPLFCRARQELRSMGIRTLLPTLEALQARSKPRLPALAARIGLSCPETIVCRSPGHVRGALEAIGVPCIIKGRECGVFPVGSRDAFAYFASRCVESFGYPVLVQRWIEGEEFSLLGLSDAHRQIQATVAVKKIGIADDGETWMGVTVHQDQFTQYARKFVQELAWVGPYEFDLLQAGDRTYLLDVNPRFPSWIDGLVEAGFNAPTMAVTLVLGHKRPPTCPVVSGIVMFKDFEDHCFPLSELSEERSLC